MITINLYYRLTIFHSGKFEQELCIFENKITQKYLFIRFVGTVFFIEFLPLVFPKNPPLYISFLPFIFPLLLLHSDHFLHLTCFFLQHELSLYSWATFCPIGLFFPQHYDEWRLLGLFVNSSQLSNIMQMYQTNYCRSIRKLQKASSDNPVSFEILPQKVRKHVDFACLVQLFTLDGFHGNLPLDP